MDRSITSEVKLDAPSSRKTGHPPIGVLLRQWRVTRALSQLDLAEDCGLSVRHLSFVENGRAQPSRGMIVRLADTLGLSLRERNALLLAAGFAPQYRESGLDADAMTRMRQAIELILEHQEPYPAFVIDRYFDVVMANAAAARVNAFVMAGRQSRHSNLLHQIFDPEDFRRHIENFDDVARKFIHQLHAELAVTPSDRRLQSLLDEVLRYPGARDAWQSCADAPETSPLLTVNFTSAAGTLRFFETITTFAAPRDVTLDELRIDCAFPADEATAVLCARLRADESSGPLAAMDP